MTSLARLHAGCFPFDMSRIGMPRAFATPSRQTRWDFTQDRSLFALMKLKVWLPKVPAPAPTTAAAKKT